MTVEHSPNGRWRPRREHFRNAYFRTSLLLNPLIATGGVLLGAGGYRLWRGDTAGGYTAGAVGLGIWVAVGLLLAYWWHRPPRFGRRGVSDAPGAGPVYWLPLIVGLALLALWKLLS